MNTREDLNETKIKIKKVKHKKIKSIKKKKKIVRSL